MVCWLVYSRLFSVAVAGAFNEWLVSYSCVKMSKLIDSSYPRVSVEQCYISIPTELVHYIVAVINQELCCRMANSGVLEQTEVKDS